MIRATGSEALFRVKAPFLNLASPMTQNTYSPFVILSAPRTGSTLLAERCDSHPLVTCYGELLNPDVVDWSHHDRPHSGWIRRYRDQDRIRFLNALVWHRQPKDVHAVGFKLLYHQFLPHRATLVPYLLKQRRLRVILLRRQNLLANLVSAKVALCTGQYNVRDVQARPDLPQVTLKPDQCEDWFKRIRLNETMLGALFREVPCLDITYEDLVRDVDASDARICEFLGVDARRLRQDTIKLDRFPLSERIENYDTLKRHFAATRWAEFFSDDAGASVPHG